MTSSRAQEWGLQDDSQLRYLVTQCASGRCVLFVGAGLSLACADDSGRHGPSGPQLAEELAQRFLGESAASHSLSLIVEFSTGPIDQVLRGAGGGALEQVAYGCIVQWPARRVTAALLRPPLLRHLHAHAPRPGLQEPKGLRVSTTSLEVPIEFRSPVRGVGARSLPVIRTAGDRRKGATSCQNESGTKNRAHRATPPCRSGRDATPLLPQPPARHDGRGLPAGSGTDSFPLRVGDQAPQCCSPWAEVHERTPLQGVNPWSTDRNTGGPE